MKIPSKLLQQERRFMANQPAMKVRAFATKKAIGGFFVTPASRQAAREELKRRGLTKTPTKRRKKGRKSSGVFSFFR